MQRAVKVAEAQLTLSLPPVAPSVQRSITDVGLGVLNRTGRAVIEWFPPGKALWMLTRYADAAKFEAGKSPLYCYVVEGVDPRTEMT